MTRPRLLDLFCGAGGAAMGYHRAGFDVVGVDITPQKNYPFKVYRRDAFDWLGLHGVDGFDAIHASPPCQAHTAMSNRWRGKGGRADAHTNLIPDMRDQLVASELPYVIENVPGARAHLEYPYVLTGEMFGLGVHRPRLFETNFPMLVPNRPPASPDTIGVYGRAHDGRLLWRRANGSEQRAARTLEDARASMGIDWMGWRELAEAIPPAYTEYIGTQLLAYLKATVAA